MLGINRITIAQHERGLVFRNRSFKTVLEPGVYRIFDPFNLTHKGVLRRISSSAARKRQRPGRCSTPRGSWMRTRLCCG
jgi:hypothetical protein